MSEERKKPVWPWIAAVLIGLPVLYVASFGPACWIASRTGVCMSMLPVVYRPMTALLVIDDSVAEVTRRISRPPAWTSNGDGTFSFTSPPSAIFFYPRGWISKYASLGASENWKWRLEVRVEHSPERVARMDDGRWNWFRDGR
jgi:hypothetical protein